MGPDLDLTVERGDSIVSATLKFETKKDSFGFSEKKSSDEPPYHRHQSHYQLPCQ